MAPLALPTLLVLLLLVVSTAHGYGEGLFRTLPFGHSPRPLFSRHPTLTLVADEDDSQASHSEAAPKLHCRHEHLDAEAGGTAPVFARLLGRLPSVEVGSSRCAEVVVRSDSSRNW